MRVNTDGVLLGAWIQSKNPVKILDIGTGTGIIMLMMAQRFSSALVHGVEIEENAYSQARANVELTEWKNRIEVFHNDFGKYSRSNNSKYDLIVSNPPYFTKSLHNPRAEKRIARHSESLPFEVLIKGVNALLSDSGSFYIILPADNTDFEREAFIGGLKCQRKMLVRSLPHKNYIRQMLELRKDLNGPIVSEELSIHQQQNEYSDSYKNLTKDFYLNF
jgi:tRNA1Val (adenine37-N6)-methyltransferase